MELRSALLIFVAGCGAAATSGPRVVETAAGALGAGKLEDIQTLVLEGGGEISAFGQNPTLGGKLATWKATEQRRTIDFAHRRWRESLVLTPTFVTGWPDPQRATNAYDDGIAFELGDDGKAARQDAATERDRRADFYHHPIAWLRAARAPGAVLENARREGAHDAVDLIADGTRFTLFVDRATRLPARIASIDHAMAVGDVTVATEFSEFVDAGGWKLPGRFTKRIDGAVVADFRVASTRVNADAGELAAPADARAPLVEEPARVTVEDVAPGVWYVTGQFHHSVVVEFADHLTLIEAPVDDARTLAVIAKARALRPGKPLTHVVNTHHHTDHSGGLRAAISEGLTIITHESNRTYYEQIARRPATVAPDALAKRPRAAVIEGVGDKRVVTDGVRSIEIYPISGNAHCPTNLMIYFPGERLLVEADAYQPPPREGVPPKRHPFAENLVKNIQRRGLDVERVLPLHGYRVPYTELEEAPCEPYANGRGCVLSK